MVAFALPVLLGLIVAASAVGLLIFGIFDADRLIGAASAEPTLDPHGAGLSREKAVAAESA